MTFEQLHSFYLVASLGSFQKAAEQLHATQPTISARIMALEGAMKTKLFDRRGYRAVLTIDGHRFLSYVERLLRLKEAALADIGGIGVAQNAIRLGASDSMANTWVPDFMSELSSAYSGICFDLHVASSPRLLEDVTNQRLDIAFILRPAASGPLIIEPLCTFEMVLAASPSLGLHRSVLRYQDINDCNVLSFDRSTEPYRMLKKDLEAANVLPRLSAISSLYAATLLAEKGLGIAALPKIALSDSLAKGRLVELETELALTPLTFCAAYYDGPSAPTLGLLAKWAAKVCRDRCEELAAGISTSAGKSG
ncbi:LysR family transcriptional regulator [Bordetella sp. BOR01]|uniref:LysR family transcriptional regulator n=1 Tax=Bordetella sp. BOR01 TaxID=2854779 RepID=UPI001C47710B|nr:LysR family transcriptional regulator [Bordetella sp. BOR01]MBV7483758.1 LysR family transcriptional regulator [Bordetella sp. BOR01]